MKHITDERMLLVMDFIMKRDNLKQGEYCQSVGIIQNHISNIRKGSQSFNHEQIRNTCLTYKVNANYIYALSNQMFLSDKKQNPIQVIEQALQELKEMSKKKKH